MYKQAIFYFFLFLFISQTFSQSNQYVFSEIDSALLENANAVVRDDFVEIEVESTSKMIITTTLAVTILNEQGIDHASVGNVYDMHSKIRNQQAIIYNAAGEEIKKIKGSDFIDRSLVSSNDIFSDNRIRYVNYKPSDYPFTIVYESEIETSSTLFVRPWRPVKDFNTSIVRSDYRITNPQGFPIRIKEERLDSLEIKKHSASNILTYNLVNFPAVKQEFLNPGLDEITPSVKVVFNEYNLAGVDGKATNWSEFGKWQYDNLLVGRDVLPEETVKKITALVADAENDKEKAKRIYEYMQGRTRYISVQLGIGGWQPMTAESVDRLGYGDCKALTNYMHALLATQGIESYYTVVHAGRDQQSIDPEFASMQGNHVILKLPFGEEEDVWLECTSQTHPFNYLGNFTDDRNVLVIKPEGGVIERTPSYSGNQNLVKSTVKVQLDLVGNFSAMMERSAGGVAYGNNYLLATLTPKEQEEYYKNDFGHIKNVDFQTISFNNDKLQQKFTEEIELIGESYTSKAGHQVLLPLNFLSADDFVLPRVVSRELGFEMKRSHTFKDSYEFMIPDEFEVIYLPEEMHTESEFGEIHFKAELKQENNKNIISVEKTFVLNKGEWTAEFYSEYRDFFNKRNICNNLKAIVEVKK